MSGTMVYNPLPGRWGALRAGDTDTRTKQFGPDLIPIQDTIASISSVTITRQDGVTMGGSDLAILQSPALDSAALNVTLWLGGGIAGVTYNVEIVVATAASRTLARDTLILVMAERG